MGCMVLMGVHTKLRMSFKSFKTTRYGAWMLVSARNNYLNLCTTVALELLKIYLTQNIHPTCD
jgi:hypothetical protein